MDLLFLVMPFADLDQPSLGVSLLQALATAGGFSSRVRYYTFPLAERIGADFYRHSHGYFGSTLFAGDWLFAESLFGSSAPPVEKFVRGALALHRELDDPEADLRRFDGKRFVHYLEENIMPRLLAARPECSKLVDRAAHEILAAAPRVAAFTVGSQQLCAALAVARRLKQSPDAPLVIFGGASCFGEMGMQILRSFPWVDYVCTGEGDQVFPAFLEQVLRKEDPTPLPGMLGRGARELTLPPLTTRLDELPFPDFRDYFEQLGASGVYQDVADEVVLPLETSRGCWWGHRSQCGFCGNHPQMQTYRSKSAQRAAKEVAHLVQTYEPRRLALADDILDHRYFRTLFPLLASGGRPTPFFCESKVNLTRSQLKQLCAAGCDMVQFGIETLSSRLLRLLPKGCSPRHAIQTLRWAQELGMHAGWNLLYGIAGELPEDYEAMAVLLPLLAHLPPPLGCVRVAIKRFSPYYLNSFKFGLSRVRPAPAYTHIFPLTPEEIEGLAYYFVADYTAADPLGYVAPVRHEVGTWIEQWSGPADERPLLDLWRVGPSAFLVIDTRPCALRPAHRLEGLTADVYTRCDSARSVRGLVRDFTGLSDEKGIREALATLVAARLMWQDGDRFLALALFRNREDDRGGWSA
jgi:ribosomal peptide maturation radical SAM protein 1